MSSTWLALKVRSGKMYGPRAVADEVTARAARGDWTNAFGWATDQYSKLFMFAAEESRELQLLSERAPLADRRFLDSQAPMPFAGYAVYVLSSAEGDLLYVGQSQNVWRRVGNHATKPWGSRISSVRVIACASREEALELEARLIRDLEPKHNVHGRWSA